MNIEQEKKKNLRLAIGVGALGVVGFAAVYFIMLVIMIASPFSMFKILPDVSWTADAIGAGQKLFLFTKHLDFTGATHEAPPQEKNAIEIFDGTALSGRAAIGPFSSVYTAHNKVYLFSEGRYRIFDGGTWEQIDQAAIGKSPRGAVSDAGIWILSRIGERAVLALLHGNSVSEIALPDELPAEDCSARPVAVGNVLLLFWEKSPYLLWSSYDGAAWTPASSFAHAGRYRAIPSDNGGIHLFLISQIEGRTKITLTTYENSLWSEPATYEPDAFAFHVIPVLFQNRPAVIMQGFFSQSYYFLDQSRPRGPQTIRTQLLVFSNPSAFIAFILAANVLAVLAVYFLSALIGKYKLGTWQTPAGEYAFASLFRRFCAKTIDSIIIMVPVLGVLYVSLSERMLTADPFRFIAITAAGIMVIIVGGFLYHALLEGIWGKTLGKKICGILVLKDDFTPCTLGAGFIRNLMRLVDNMFYYLAGVTAMAGTMKWQRLGDLVAETVVVRERTSNSPPTIRSIQS